MSNSRDSKSDRLAKAMQNDPFFKSTGPLAAQPVPDDDVEALDEADLILEDDDDGGFDDEATAVFSQEEQDAFYAADDDDGGFDDEHTQVWASGAGPDGGYGPSVSHDPPFVPPPDDPPFVPPPDDPPFVPPPDDEFADESTIVSDPSHFPLHASGGYASHQPIGSAPASQQRVQPSVPVPTVATTAAQAAVPPERNNTHALLVALLVIALLGVGVLAAMLLGSDDDAVVAEAVNVAVFTEPSGATIVLDGEELEDRTDTILRGLEPGTQYALALRLDGYEPHSEIVSFAASDEAHRFEYTFDAALGTLTVSSSPDGAAISLDGRPVGDAPQTLGELDLNRTYQLTAQLDGYAPASQTIRWESGETQRNVALTLAPLTVAEGSGETADEAVADSEAAGEEAGEAEQSEPGDEPDRVAAAEPEERRERSDTSDRDEPETPPSRTQREPSSSRPPSTSATERPSSRTAERPSSRTTERPSSRTTERPSARTAERPSARVDEPEPTAAGTGNISIQAVPYGQVWIDGRMVSPETPLMNHELSVGVHQVKVYFVPIRQFSDERSVRVEPGSSRTITFRAPR